MNDFVTAPMRSRSRRDSVNKIGGVVLTLNPRSRRDSVNKTGGAVFARIGYKVGGQEGLTPRPGKIQGYLHSKRQSVFYHCS